MSEKIKKETLKNLAVEMDRIFKLKTNAKRNDKSYYTGALEANVSLCSLLGIKVSILSDGIYFYYEVGDINIKTYEGKAYE